MDESSLRLDGNALAGLLRQIFTHEMTDASSACAGCGAVARIGDQHLYGYPDGPGAVLRCCRCESVLLVIVSRERRYRLGAQDLAWIDVEVGTELLEK